MIMGEFHMIPLKINNYNHMKQFIVKLIGITVAVAVAGWLVFSLFLPEYYLAVLPFLLLFFFIVTLVLHTYQINLAKKDMGRFTRSIMLVTFFKLILFSVVAFGYIAYDSENALVFVICLMLLYIIFTFFEVAEITRISHTGQK
jgi:hypothetical protein